MLVLGQDLALEAWPGDLYICATRTHMIMNKLITYASTVVRTLAFITTGVFY
jgi:hypothetical protein